jgi:hypothetical protein
MYIKCIVDLVYYSKGLFYFILRLLPRSGVKTLPNQAQSDMPQGNNNQRAALGHKRTQQTKGQANPLATNMEFPNLTSELSHVQQTSINITPRSSDQPHQFDIPRVPSIGRGRGLATVPLSRGEAELQLQFINEHPGISVQLCGQPFNEQECRDGFPPIHIPSMLQDNMETRGEGDNTIAQEAPISTGSTMDSQPSHQRSTDDQAGMVREPSSDHQGSAGDQAGQPLSRGHGQSTQGLHIIR